METPMQLIRDVAQHGVYWQGWVEYQHLDRVQDFLRAAGYGVSVQRGEDAATVTWWICYPSTAASRS